MRINYKKTAQLFLSSFFSTLLFVLGVYFFSLPTLAAPGINRTINFQGKVVNKSDSTNVTNGSYTFVFKLYDASSGGNQLPTGTPWSESQSLTVTNGVFRASLGEVTPIPTTIDFNSDALWLDVTFNGETFGSRIRLTAVPYAFNAEKVAGLTVTNTTGTLTIPNAKTISFADAFTTSGAFPLTLTTTASTNITLPTTGTLATLAGAEIFTNKTIGSTGLVFSGATTDITTVGNEDLIITPAGTGMVGIGITPDYYLHVNGDMRVEYRSYFNGLNSITLTSTGDYESGYIHGEYGSLSLQPVSGGGIIFLNSSNAQYFTFENDTSRFGFGLNNTSPTEIVDILGNATASGNITMGGQLQVGRFGYDPIAFGNGSISYNTTTNKFRCYQNGAWTDCIGGGGSSVWSDLTAPTTNLSMNMYQSVGTSFSTTFTYGNATSTTNLFNITDTASNTGTGYLLNLVTASSSTAKPLRVVAAGTNALFVDSNGRVGIGATSPSAPLHVDVPATNVQNGTTLLVDGDQTSTTQNQYGIKSVPYISPGSASSRIYGGFFTLPYTDSTNIANAQVVGVQTGAYFDGTGNLSTMIGLNSQLWHNSTGQINTLQGINIGNIQISNGGTVSQAQGLTIADISGATKNTNVLIGTTTSPNGNWSIYNTSTYSNYFAGNLGIANTNPLQKLDITGNATASGNITLGGQLQVGRFGYDPIAFGNGSISYNTTTNKFRCYQNGSWTDCIGAGGTPTWDSITNPGGNLGLTMNSYTSTFTYGSSTSTNNLFTLADTASNTGTGYLFNLTTGSGSTLNPLRVRNGLADTLIIDSNGRIGVNTAANLTEALNVNGNFSFAPNDGSGRSLGVLFNTSGGGDGTNLDIFAGGGDLGFGGDLSLYAGTGGGGPGGSVYIYGGSGTSQGNVILAHLAGKVAVGHTIPTEMLDVLGNATVSGYLTVGQAGGIRSQYGGLNFQYKSNQNAWTTGMVLKDSTGFLGLGNLNPTANLDISSSQTTGNAVNITANSLTSGNGMYLSSTATALTGDLLSLYLNPASASTITGDVLGINSGSNLTLSGYYLNIQNNGSAVFQVGQNQIVSAVPHSFTAAGDVSMAYDLIFTNSTASYIKSDSPFYVESGPVWGSNDLTLRTFNYGKVIADSDTLYAVKDLGVGGSATISGQLRLGNYAVAPTAAGAGSLYYDSGANKVYYYNGSAWTEMGAGTSSGPSVFQEAAGIIRPMNNTADVLFGGTATASAKFAFLNLNSGTPMLRIDNDSDNTNKGCFRYNGTSNQMEYSNDCSTFQGFSSSTGGGWTDDGTTVRLTTSTDNLGVGTATAPEKLTVSGNATASGNITMGGQMLLGRFGYDPTSLGNGSMYYNTTTNKFRCYQNGAWADCVGGSSLTSAFVLKGSNETITNSTALQDDDALTFSVASGEQWYFNFDVIFTTNNNATPDIRLAVNSSAATTTCTYGVESISHAGNLAGGQATTCNTAIVVATTATGAKHAVVSGTVRGMTGSGSVVLRWAQGTVDATNGTTVVTGSSLLAFRISGADLGELYMSKSGSLEPGTVVSVDPSILAGVRPSSMAYDNSVIGVVSTKPGLVIGDADQMNEGMPVVVALSGRIPVKVSDESGPVKAGDYLTSSSKPGIAMRATQAGVIIGQALTDYDPVDGTVLAFVKNGFYNGVTASEYSSDKVVSFSLLNTLLNEKNELVNKSTIQQLTSDRIVGGLEIVAPEVITDTVSTKSLTSTDNLDIRISPEGELRIGSTTATDTATIRFDAEGNAYFAGALSANRILASSIAGLDELSARIASLEARIHNSSQSALLNYDALIPSSTLSAVLEGLTLTQDATIGGKLQVKGSALIEGVLSVIDTVTSSNVVVSSWFSSMGKAIFHDSVQFMGRPTFNADTGGYVVIKKGTQSVDVEFTNEYESMPVINVTRVTESENLQSAFNTSVRYVIGKRTTKGFTIQLDQNASEDMTFSWTALSISAKAQ